MEFLTFGTLQKVLLVVHQSEKGASPLQGEDRAFRGAWGALPYQPCSAASEAYPASQVASGAYPAFQVASGASQASQRASKAFQWEEGQAWLEGLMNKGEELRE